MAWFFKMSTIIVFSRLQSAVELRLHELVEREPGIKTARRVGEPAVLRPGRNVVDADFWRAWSEQHKGGLAVHFAAEEAPSPL